ncbi:ABC transporter ATP-binding protein [Brevibacillus massiliensis]|uniref:ABC transporter ATP-binding protein n=1 Tax=Brevibacillus massiliensis TaxID=1118054 RepID=UPI000301FA5E|nr:ABC transporter ATP-binding protein [Brevibacillus massiliensis]
MTILSTENLLAGYDGAAVLHGVNIEIKEGEMVALIGRNGVGKTTFVKSVTRLISDTHGNINFNGTNISNWSIHKVARAGIRLVPENRGIFPKLTVYENLEVSCLYAQNINKSEIKNIFRLFPRLEERKNLAAGLMSGGEQQMLSIGRALLARPKLLLVDEFSEGLQPSITKEIADVLRETNQQEGLPILLVEQNANLALKMTTRAYIMVKGQIIHTGSSEELLKNDQILKENLVI